MRDSINHLTKSLRWYHIVGLYVLGIVISIFLTAIVVNIFGVDTRSDKIALFQTVLAIVVFIPSFVAIIQQAKESADLTILLSKISDPDKKINVARFDRSLGLNVQDGTKFILMNTGNIVTIWFCVRFYVDVELVNTGHFREELVIGEEHNWTETDVIYKEKPFKVYTFLSNGQFGSYVNDSLVLFQLIRSQKSLIIPKEGSFPVYYFITSDKGSQSKGIYHIEVRK